METQLKSLIEKYCLNSYLTDIQLDEIIDLALATKANPKEVEEYIQEKTEDRKARIDAERKAKEEAERKAREAKEEAERKAKEAKEEAERKAKEAVLIKIVETSNSISLLLAQKFNEVINEVGTDHDAVKEYKKRMRKEALDAYMHRKDSPEAVERNRVLWAEYDKIVKAIQSGRVEIMDDLKRELDINLSNEAQKTDTISQKNDNSEETEREYLAAIEQAKREKEETERKAKEKAERAQKERIAAIERAKLEKEEAERKAKEKAERAEKERIAAIERAKREKEEAERFNGHDYVDFGLPIGTLWATCNLGASSPEQEGDLFAWGETKTKSEFKPSNYKFSKGGFLAIFSAPTKYKENEKYTQLDIEDDAARAQWGGAWQMPTDLDFMMLFQYCKVEKYTIKGVEGLRVSRNGKSIFFPKAGAEGFASFAQKGDKGRYWTSSTISKKSGQEYIISNETAAQSIEIFLEKAECVDFVMRYCGLSIRPVIH